MVQRQQFEAGTLIFKEGDASSVAYMVESGRIEILKKAPHGDVSVAMLAPGELFGEIGLFEDAPRSASARAVEPTVLHVIDRAVVQAMVEQCGEPLRKIIRTAFDRLRAANQKITEKDKAVTLVDCDFDTLLIEPEGDAMAALMAPLEIPVNKLPFRIGGYPKQEGSPSTDSANHMDIASDAPPLLISRKHLMIELQENKAFIVDRGSRFGTIVNGQAIGKGKGSYKYPISKGEYHVVFAGKHSPYKLKITCR